MAEQVLRNDEEQDEFRKSVNIRYAKTCQNCFRYRPYTRGYASAKTKYKKTGDCLLFDEVKSTQVCDVWYGTESTSMIRRKDD